MDDDNLTPKLQSVKHPVSGSMLGFVPSALTHNHAAADFSSDSLVPASDTNPLLTTSRL
ncbi:hypothetical protein BC941DRAFT_464381 [Chlamydoabsidia padenii]|nr:hypothetical protein BC941DRAFT_464381 [Chlamydoabsidia padenii]